MKLQKIFNIFLILGWLGFLYYNMHLAVYLAKTYQKTPELLEIEGEECKAMMFINTFYFEKVNPFLKLTGLLILLTLISKLDPAELKKIGSRIKEMEESIKEEGK